MEIGNLANLEQLAMAYNEKFQPSALPKEFGALKKLKYLWMTEANLIGEIPESFNNLSNLELLDLSVNKLEGGIPSGIWTSPNMVSVMLDGNSFSGTLPSKLARNLSRVEIANNKFYGPIPAEISSWMNISVLNANNNMLSGKIPVELTSLWNITVLLLDENQFSGELPSQIISWKSLNKLNLSRNKLSGLIPKALGSLTSLSYLDLSENQFSGQIPPKLGHLNLIILHLSSNQLSGMVPIEFQHEAYEDSFLNNPKLCVNVPTLNLPRCDAKPVNSDKLSTKYLVMILIFALAGAFVSLSKVHIYHRKNHSQDHTAWKFTPYHKLDLDEYNILSSLTENNLIVCGGSGKVYRVANNRSGELLAVKMICNNRRLDQKLQKQFETEVEILSTMRHANIVKLLCCISNETSSLLVYEYMEKQSLDRWLHGKKQRTSSMTSSVHNFVLDWPTRKPIKWLHGKKQRTSSMTSSVHNFVLDWPTRLQIAIGAAKGLCHMHENCSAPIIHRDVKSSNILLDAEFNAKIADFGLAKMLVKQGEPDTMSGIAGSYGYIAPEYAYTTKVNEKIDVYSFGVVLLELVTGRKPNSGDEHMCLVEWVWDQFREGKTIEEVMDEEIKEQCERTQVTTLFSLGLMCTTTLPSTRPTMKEVLEILRQCSPQEGLVERKRTMKLHLHFEMTLTPPLTSYDDKALKNMM
ncbi:hypothetical protein VitviT2T_004369 [Vitis vinifera]|uniref:Protein kinase domain-containing protein n=2 Tax=Vitis vinifera TaxID=29760 RepID=A0ABY9BPS2_VITVI|nr:hypothetical protein VitviT2T_004369 [Vitis vinifera]